ncbi:MAG: NAD-dependent DNA ligase LigA [Eubacteriales bacterium]|nr:NAD-dependent DNA ligase LigA [Christensenellaceae bacterium]MDY2750702.1 NAD-dependent DNA ligase LigA [Eubacteriales bacterium]
MSVLEEMQNLVKELNFHAEQYYKFDSPVISDGEYDKLYDRLVALEKETGFVLPDSPTRRVGDDVLKEFKQYRHTHKLYSLDKCQSYEELLAWRARTEKALGRKYDMTAEYKFDGLTINLTYENGALVSAATRGNGLVGEDVTSQVKTIKNVPLTIDYKNHVEIQGEGIMRLSVLEKYNRTHDEPLKNARNGAAGAIRNLNPKVTAERRLDVMCYNVYGPRFDTQAEMQEFLKEQGFETGDYFRIVKTDSDAEKCVEELEKKRPTLDFLIDGIVFKINEVALRDILGETEKFPKWAVAYKFKADEATTVLRDVIWQVSRTGKLNPLAVLDPVELAGVTVKRATLNNFADYEKKGLKIGSRVFIRRSNDVIPEILGIASHTSESREIEKPKFCPYCGAPVEEKGVFLYCTNNETCAPQIVQKLTHFAEKGAMDIEGFSDKTAELLLNELKVKDFSDIYKLRKEDLTGLEGFGDLKAGNLIASIEKSKNVGLSDFLYALGIKNIGKKAAKQLETRFKTLNGVMNAGFEELTAIDDFGEVMAKSVVEYFSDEAKRQEIDKLTALGINVKSAEKKEGVFSGINAVLTGSLSGYKRSEAEKLIVERGGECSSSVSKAVNLVIAGEEAGSKLEKAKKLGIKIIGEDEFTRMLEQ